MLIWGRRPTGATAGSNGSNIGGSFVSSTTDVTLYVFVAFLPPGSRAVTVIVALTVVLAVKSRTPSVRLAVTE